MCDRVLYSILVLALLSLSAPAQAQPFVLRTSVFSAGGQQSTGGNLVLQSTLGQPGVGRATMDNLVLDGGFWPSVTSAAGPVALPTAADDAATTDEDTPVVIDVLANDTNPGGGAVLIESYRRGAIGTVAITDTMTLVYSPLLNAHGQDTFTYRIVNDVGGSAEATVTVIVNPVNDAPFFSRFPAEGAVPVGSEYRYQAKALDADGDALAFTAPVLPAWLALVEPTDSTVTLAGTPTTAEAGVHPVTMTVSDGQASDTLSFIVSVATQSTLAAPVLAAPEHGAANQPLGVQLRWNPVVGATSYEVRIDTDSTFQLPFVADIGTVGTQFTAQDLLAPNTTYYWRVRAVDASGPGPYSSAFRFMTVATNVSTEDEAGVPEAFALHQNYPNPFNPTTTIAYALPQATEVRLTVYDLFGRAITTLINAPEAHGRHEVTFQADGLASGTYFYRIEAGPWSQTRQFILLK